MSTGISAPHAEGVGRQSARAWSPARVLGEIALGAWGFLFWFLLLSGRTSLYLSSRTSWVVPLGAAILTLAFVARLGSLRTDHPEPVTARDAWRVGLVIVPVVTVLALPPGSLGAYAAARRSALAGAGFAGSPEGIESGTLSLIDVAAGLRSREGSRALAKRAGSEVSFTGFVTRDAGAPAEEFVLTRFLISCCVADALTVEVRVVGAPPGEFEPDDWVRVEGRLYPLGREAIVDATRVTGVPRPKHPYLNP